MAQLPPDGEWLVQMNGTMIHVFHRYTQQEIAAFDALDEKALGAGMKAIAASEQLDLEQRSFAHFWVGYYWAHANTYTTTVNHGN